MVSCKQPRGRDWCRHNFRRQLCGWEQASTPRTTANTNGFFQLGRRRKKGGQQIKPVSIILGDSGKDPSGGPLVNGVPCTEYPYLYHRQQWSGSVWLSAHAASERESAYSWHPPADLLKSFANPRWMHLPLPPSGAAQRRAEAGDDGRNRTYHSRYQCSQRLLWKARVEVESLTDMETASSTAPPVQAC